MNEPLLIFNGEDFPIANPTATALAAIIDPSTKKVKEVVKGLDALYVNFGTLSRNILNAISTESDDPTPDSLADSIRDDMRIIQEVCKDAKIKCIFYRLTRKSFDDHFPLAIKTIVKTPKQIQFKELTEDAIEKIISESSDDADGVLPEWEIIDADMVFDIPYSTVAMLTSFPTDLVTCLEKIPKAWCIQSFTGKVVPKQEFNKFLFKRKKHENHPAVDRIRFSPFFLQLFGDGKLISPSSPKTIDGILDCAAKRNWTLATTKEKFKLDMELEGIWDPNYASAKF